MFFFGCYKITMEFLNFEIFGSENHWQWLWLWFVDISFYKFYFGSHKYNQRMECHISSIEFESFQYKIYSIIQYFIALAIAYGNLWHFYFGFQYQIKIMVISVSNWTEHFIEIPERSSVWWKVLLSKQFQLFIVPCYHVAVWK